MTAESVAANSAVLTTRPGREQIIHEPSVRAFDRNLHVGTGAAGSSIFVSASLVGRAGSKPARQPQDHREHNCVSRLNCAGEHNSVVTSLSPI